jgi:hypothetical protein
MIELVRRRLRRIQILPVIAIMATLINAPARQANNITTKMLSA